MSDSDLSHRLLDESRPAIPPSMPPSIERLSGMARSRQRSRSRQRVACLSIACVALLIAAVRTSGTIAAPSSTRGVYAESRVAPVPKPIARVEDSALAGSDAAETRIATLVSGEESAVHASPSVRAFARVSRTVPLFDMDQETQTLTHVGWTSSDKLVPVDVSGFSMEQQQTIEAVLRETTGPPTYSL